jgi:hypothetical protein
MTALLLIWFGLLVGLLFFAIGRPGRGGALTLAYFLGLSLIHVPGLLPFVASDWAGVHFGASRIGFETTIIGMAGFVAGAAAGARSGPQRGKRAMPVAARELAAVCGRLGRRLAVIGAAAYLVLLPAAVLLPSANAITSPLISLAALGFWLLFYAAVMQNDKRKLFGTLALLPLLPATTLVSAGFLSCGINWSIAAMAFPFAINRRRWWMYAAAPAAAFVGLSLFTTYMAQRTQLREVIWHGDAGIRQRLELASRMITDFTPLDLASPAQAAALEGRLNQNWLVGEAVLRHDAGEYDFALGGTVPYWALIPRAIWADKPAVGGSGSLVAEFTGLRFGEGTSIGIGQVMEFYVNFGIGGVIVGFAGLGFALSSLDRRIMIALSEGDFRKLLLLGTPGVSLLNPGGSILEVLVACIGAIVGTQVLLHIGIFNNILSSPAPALPRRALSH